MKLSAISVSRFRSILEATRVELGDFTVLIGKNNEGKSNFLRALQISFAVIKDMSERRGLSERFYPRFREYDWNRDYPLAYRDREKGRRDTTFRVSFELTEAELEAFSEQFGTRLSTSLTLEIVLSESGAPKIRWAKQGQSAGKLDSRMGELAGFIQDRFTFLYIPAIRTETESTNIIYSLVSKKLALATKTQEYIAATEQLRLLEQPIFDQLSKDTLETIKSFLPNISSVRFERRSRPTSAAMMSRDVEISVDDGNDTKLAYKGDGVKSIIALALFKHGVPDATSSMLAIEEPEAHLHAGAIHELKAVLKQIGQTSQVVVTTHSHSFISRDRPQSNIVVHEGKVRVAKSTNEIRQMMGVRASDNLISAETVIVVEGKSDERILNSIFSRRSLVFKNAFKEGAVVFDILGGASKLAHKSGMLRRELFSFLVIMDADDPGRAAIRDALNNQCIEEHEYKLLNVIGLGESEIEDLIKPEVYITAMSEKYGLTIARNSIPGRGKWADRVRDLFLAQGKLWDDGVKLDVKEIVADQVCSFEGDPVAVPRGDVLQSVTAGVEGLILRELAKAE